jgi:aspartyl-tRNA(Asn)/glutamyl-tRNA(Gln) amidotransferase subunit A
MMQQPGTAFSSLAELARGLQKKEFTSVELTQLYLDRIDRFDGCLNAYVSVWAESALQQAHAADLQRHAGVPLPPLHGLPIAIKDLCEISGEVTTFGSQAWTRRRSPVTSTVVQRLLDAGMIVLGKTHMVEFAFGGWGTNPLMGTPRNPWDMTGHHRAPGGSSSGSGVVVAGGLAPAAIGSDTGGSVRVPAAFNGLTGLKTSSGLISQYGALALSPSLDTLGFLTRSAEDAGLLTAMLAGPDPRDPGTVGRPQFHFDCGVNTAPPARRIALMRPDQYPWPVTHAVQQSFDEAVRVFKSLGAQVDAIDLPFDFVELMQRTGKIIAVEAFHQHAHYIDDANLAFGPWVRKRVQAGGLIDADAHQALLAQRSAEIERFAQWMQPYDVLMTPTLPFEACPVSEIDEAITPVGAFNRAVNYLDACAITLPAGLSENGLPLGVQLIAPSWQDNLLLQCGQAFQSLTDWHRRHPADLA